MNRDLAILDANFSRAKEGIRVLEDICRFVLRDEEKWAKLKTIRHELKNFENLMGRSELLLTRNFDFGSQEVVKTEYDRKSTFDLIQANTKRTTEALRVLEEYFKIYNLEQAYKLENYRYSLYSLELSLSTQTPQFWLNKYFERGVIYPISSEVEDIIWFVNHGAKIIQLRDKESSRQVVYEKAKTICKFLFEREKKYKEKIIFIINDDVEIAAALPVSGVHLGQKDAKISVARKIIGSYKIIGKSNNNLEDLKNSVAEGADYVSIGPVFKTPIKAEREPVGLETVKIVSEEVSIPWVVIGGINIDNVDLLYKNGAKILAVIRSAKEFYK